MIRPTCVTCGKHYGRRKTELKVIFCPDNGGHPPMAEPHSGRGIVTEENYIPDDENWRSGSRSVLNTQTGRSFHSVILPHGETRPTGRTCYRTIWIEGDYDLPHKPFCTMKCGMVFARSAFSAGYRLTKTLKEHK